jgi:hypothetical protein
MTRSDSVDERLYIECKTRKRCATRTILMDARSKAKKEGKIAIVVERETGKPGAIWSIHQDDLYAFCIEFAGRRLTPTTLAENFKPLGDNNNEAGEPGQDR